MVASIGHAHESALFVLPDGTARGFDPDGRARRSRLAEAFGPEQEAAKDRILRAKTLEERTEAYRQLLRLSPLHQESTRLWAEDSRFVLDELEDMNRAGGRFEGLLDVERVGALGHSLGGATAGQLALVEDRVTAGINIDGFQFGDLLAGRLTKPFMFVAAQRPWAGESTISNDIFYEASKAPAHIVLFRGFEHSTFTDLSIFGLARGAGEGPGSGDRALELQRVYIRAFFDRYLRGRPSPLLDATSPDHSEAMLRSRRYIMDSAKPHS